MKIVGCDLHTRYQQIAMLDQETGELIERRLEHESRRSESGAVFATTQAAVRDGSRSSRNGRHENANERREDSVQR